MRVKLTLMATKPGARIPLDHQHAVASLIYSTLGSASTNFTAKLHDVGYQQAGRNFKLFTFSRIHTRSARVLDENLVLQDPVIELQISSPVIEFIDLLVKGFSGRKIISIRDSEFELVRTELVLAPQFAERMEFRSLSPITESYRNGETHPRFLSLEDNWSEIMQRNLARKYEALYGREPDDTRLCWSWDKEYLAQAALRGKRFSALRDIKGIKIRGWLAPFTIEGSRELIELGYEAGFGARNSMGFGMAEPHNVDA